MGFLINHLRLLGDPDKAKMRKLMGIGFAVLIVGFIVFEIADYFQRKNSLEQNKDEYKQLSQL